MAEDPFDDFPNVIDILERNRKRIAEGMPPFNPDAQYVFEARAWREKWTHLIRDWLEKARLYDEQYKTYIYKDEEDNAVLQIAVDVVEKAEKWDRYLAVLSDPELEGEQEIMAILVKCAENAKHLKSAKELAKQMYVTECESSQMNRLVRTLYRILEGE